MIVIIEVFKEPSSFKTGVDAPSSWGGIGSSDISMSRLNYCGRSWRLGVDMRAHCAATITFSLSGAIQDRFHLTMAHSYSENILKKNFI